MENNIEHVVLDKFGMKQDKSCELFDVNLDNQIAIEFKVN